MANIVTSSLTEACPCCSRWFKSSQQPGTSRESTAFTRKKAAPMNHLWTYLYHQNVRECIASGIGVREDNDDQSATADFPNFSFSLSSRTENPKQSGCSTDKLHLVEMCEDCCYEFERLDRLHQELEETKKIISDQLLRINSRMNINNLNRIITSQARLFQQQINMAGSVVGKDNILQALLFLDNVLSGIPTSTCSDCKNGSKRSSEVLKTGSSKKVKSKDQETEANNEERNQIIRIMPDSGATFVKETLQYKSPEEVPVFSEQVVIHLKIKEETNLEFHDEMEETEEAGDSVQHNKEDTEKNNEPMGDSTIFLQPSSSQFVTPENPLAGTDHGSKMLRHPLQNQRIQENVSVNEDKVKCQVCEVLVTKAELDQHVSAHYWMSSEQSSADGKGELLALKEEAKGSNGGITIAGHAVPEKPPYICPVCQHSFKEKRSNLVDHMERLNNPTWVCPDLRPRKQVVYKYKCEHSGCEYTAPTHQRLLRHKQLRHGVQ